MPLERQGSGECYFNHSNEVVTRELTSCHCSLVLRYSYANHFLPHSPVEEYLYNHQSVAEKLVLRVSHGTEGTLGCGQSGMKPWLLDCEK